MQQQIVDAFLAFARSPQTQEFVRAYVAAGVQLVHAIADAQRRLEADLHRARQGGPAPAGWDTLENVR